MHNKGLMSSLQNALSAAPAGMIDLIDADLDGVAGGQCSGSYTVNCSGTYNDKQVELPTT